jgi:signal transduction histidine kinase
LEKRKQEYKFEEIDLTAVIKQAIENYPMKVIKPDCSVEVNLANDLPHFYLDKEALSRAFINILDNALKFSPPGGIIKIDMRKINDEVFIEVGDQGPGINEEEKKRLFEPFYHTGKGTGLGLALARNIVKGHNGRIEFESQKGKGSIFKIILPSAETQMIAR